MTSGAVNSAIGGLISKDLILANEILQINEVTSTSHTVWLGTVSWNKCYAIQFNGGHYFIQGEVDIGNSAGCTIASGSDIKIRIKTNYPTYSLRDCIVSALIRGYLGLILMYGDDFYDLWFRNTTSVNIPWNNINPLVLKFSFWI